MWLIKSKYFRCFIAVLLCFYLVSCRGPIEDIPGEDIPGDEVHEDSIYKDKIVINELIAKTMDDSPDWIEIYNNDASLIDISGWIITDGEIDDDNGYIFQSGTLIDSHGLMVIERDEENGINGFQFGLSSSKNENVFLYDLEGKIVDHLSWEENLGPEQGKSLARDYETGDFITVDSPTKGMANSENVQIPIEKIIINEILRNNTNDNPSWVEIYNAGETIIDMGAWKLTHEDDFYGTTLNKNRFPWGTIVEPGNYLVVEDGLFNFTLTINESGSLRLFNSEALLIDICQWEQGDLPDNKSWGRIPNGSGDFSRINIPTKGTMNKGMSIVINEILAKSSQDEPDWIELYNISDDKVDISNWIITDKNFYDDEAFSFPQGTVIQPKDFIVFEKGEIGFEFGLGKGETLTLFDPTGTIMDITTWKDGEAPEDKTWGRFPDGNGQFITLDTPTKNESNTN